MAASRALERGREGPQSVAAGTEQPLQTIPALHWEKHNREEVWQHPLPTFHQNYPHSHPPHSKKKVLSWVCGGDSNWWLFKLDAVCLPNISALVWMSPRRAFACLEMRSMEGGERASAQNSHTHSDDKVQSFRSSWRKNIALAQYQQGLMLAVVSCLLLGFHSKYGSSAVWLPGLYYSKIFCAVLLLQHNQ